MKKFSKSFSGYNTHEVNAFVDDVVKNVDSMLSKMKAKDMEIDRLTKELEHYKTVEHTLQNTLLMAQSTAEDIKSMAQKQADQIIEDAKKEAQNILESVNKDEVDVRRKTEDLKKQFDVYKAKMEALLISQLELLQNKNEDDE